MTDQPYASTTEGSAAGDRPLDLLALARLMLADTSLGTGVTPQEEPQHRSGSRGNGAELSTSRSSSRADVDAQAHPLQNEVHEKTASATQSRGIDERTSSEPVAPATDLSAGPGLMASSLVDPNAAAIQLRAIVTAIESLPDVWRPSYSTVPQEAVVGIAPQAAWSYNEVRGGGAAPSSLQSEPSQAAEKRPPSEAAAENQSGARPSDNSSGAISSGQAAVPTASNAKPTVPVAETGSPLAVTTIGEVEASPIGLTSATAFTIKPVMADVNDGIGSLRWSSAHAAGVPFVPVDNALMASRFVPDLPVNQKAVQVAAVPAAEVSAPLPAVAEIVAPDLGSAIEDPPAPEDTSTTGATVSDPAPAPTGALGIPVPSEKATDVPLHVDATTPAGPAPTQPPMAAVPPAPASGAVPPSTPGTLDPTVAPVGGSDLPPGIGDAIPSIQSPVATPVQGKNPTSGNGGMPAPAPDASPTSPSASGPDVVAPAPVSAPGSPDGAPIGVSLTPANDVSTPSASPMQTRLPDVEYPVASDVHYNNSAPEISPALRATILEWLDTAHADLSAQAPATFVSAPQMSYLDVLLADSIPVGAGYGEAAASTMPSGSEAVGPTEPFFHSYDTGLS